MAYIINKSLSEKGVKTYTGDTTLVNINLFSLLGNRCFRYSNFYDSPESFIASLSQYLQKNDIQFLIPTHEEIFIISKYLDKLEGIATLVPAFENILTAHLKDRSVEKAKSLGIPVPDSIFPETESDCLNFFKERGREIVLKYLNSNSAKGVYHIKSIDLLKKHYQNMGSFILQEYVVGDGYGVSALYNKGYLRARFTHKRLQDKIHTGGTSTLRTSTRNEMLEEWAKKLLDSLNWNGVAMVEFKYNESTGNGWFVEINPRFWGSLALPYYSGMDFPWLYYNILREGDINPTFDYREGVKVKWLLGGAIGFVDELVNNKRVRFSHLSPKADYYDDFSWEDPFILLGESVYYLSRFISRFSLNPTKNSSINLESI